MCPSQGTYHLRELGGIIFLWVLELKFRSSSSPNFCGSVLFLVLQEAAEAQTGFTEQKTSEDKLRQRQALGAAQRTL